ncbi:hypothetical protein CF319_g8898 [Tilletia indica]|nr:hypothetical protein CF319_g8898 [Tilletia indica]
MVPSSQASPSDTILSLPSFPSVPTSFPSPILSSTSSVATCPSTTSTSTIILNIEPISLNFEPKTFCVDATDSVCISLGGANPSLPAPSSSNGIFPASIRTRHAQICMGSGEVLLHDLGDGEDDPCRTFLNGQPVYYIGDGAYPVQLRDGDRISFGHYTTTDPWNFVTDMACHIVITHADSDSTSTCSGPSSGHTSAPFAASTPGGPFQDCGDSESLGSSSTSPFSSDPISAPTFVSDPHFITSGQAPKEACSPDTLSSAVDSVSFTSVPTSVVSCLLSPASSPPCTTAGISATSSLSMAPISAPYSLRGPRQPCPEEPAHYPLSSSSSSTTSSPFPTSVLTSVLSTTASLIFSPRPSLTSATAISSLPESTRFSPVASFGPTSSSSSVHAAGVLRSSHSFSSSTRVAIDAGTVSIGDKIQFSVPTS